MTASRIDKWDISVISVYFCLFFAVGIFSMIKSMKSSSNDFFLAGRFITWLPVGASLFASNIGSEHFIGLSGSGAAKGIGIGAFELNAGVLLLLLGWFYLPVYLMSGASTLPQYMKKRFNSKRIQLYLAILSLILYILTKLSVNLYAGYLFIYEALGWNIWFSILFILAITTSITLVGGLVAVLYTDAFQCIIMVVGASILCVISFIKVGGMEGLLNSYGSSFGSYNTSSDVTKSLVKVVVEKSKESIRNELTYSHGVLNEIFRNESLKSLTCGFPNDNAFTMLRKYDDPDLPWLGFIVGQIPTSIWYWCADQMMVQRVLAAKDISHAQGATIFAGILKILPLFLIVFPGMISRVLYADVIGCATAEDCLAACNQASGCSNLAYPKLVIDLMPSGLRGLMLSVMLAALVSDLTSIFNSASTIFSIDIYTRIRKKASTKELIFVARIFVIILVVLSVCWIPIIQNFQGGQLFIYISMISAYLSPPIVAVFTIGMLWERTTELSAFLCLIIGFLIGIIRLALEFIYPEPKCGEEDLRPYIVSKVHYMYFALILIIISIFILMTVTWLESMCATLSRNKLIRSVSFDSSRDVSRLTYFPVAKELRSFNNITDEEYEYIVNAVEKEETKKAKETEHLPKMTMKEKLKDYFLPSSSNAKSEHVDEIEIEDINVGTVIRSGGILSDNEDRKLIIRMRQNKVQKRILYIFLAVIVSVTIFMYTFYSLRYEDRVLGPLKIRLSNESAVENKTMIFEGDPEPILKRMNLTTEFVDEILYLFRQKLTTFTIPV